MIKIITSDSYASFSYPTVSLIQVGRSGLDRAYMTKAAADEAFYQQLKDLRPKPGVSFLHIIGLGDGEHYGSNRNGDWFPERGCRFRTKEAGVVSLRAGNTERHHTFVKFGHVFKHHNNKDPKFSSGQILASSHNDLMKRVELIAGVEEDKWSNELQKLASGEPIAVSMACFPPGTPVLLQDGSECAIELLRRGDRVVTHHGNIGSVEHLMSREYHDDFVRFRASGLPDDVVCTSNHKIWTRPTLKGKAPRCPVCGETFRGLRSHLRQKKDPQHKLAYRDYGRYAEGWIPAEQLVTGDYIRTPFDTEVSYKGDEKYAELLGFYLSEGNVSHCGSKLDEYVDFSFGSHEGSFVKRTMELLIELGYDDVRRYDRKNNVALVRVRSHELALRLEKDGGKYSSGKSIHPDIMKWHPGTQMRLLAAFIDGDGHFNKSKPRLIATTVSRQLAFQLATICWRNDIPARIATYKNKGRLKAYVVEIQGRYVDQVPCHKIPEDYSFEPATRSIGQLKHQTKNATACYVSSRTLCYIESGFVYRRVRSVSRERYDGTVHNISVEGDSSYVVNGVAVSNCKVPYDICSVCNNRATSRQKYCFHLKHEMNKIASDGFQTFAINDWPTFFDISGVLRPADRIAYGLQKVAALSSGVVSSVDLAAELGIFTPIPVLLDGCPTKMASRIATIRKLADIEKRIEGQADGVLQLSGAVNPSSCLSSSDVSRLRGNRLSDVLRALADAEICLPMRDFMSLAFPKTNKHDLNDVIPQAKKMMPGLFGRMLEGDLDSVCGDTTFEPGIGVPGAIKSVIDKLVPEHSFASGPAGRRLTITVIKGDTPTVGTRIPDKNLLYKVSTVALTNQAAYIADCYGRYQLNFADAVGENSLASTLTVLQNYVQ